MIKNIRISFNLAMNTPRSHTLSIGPRAFLCLLQSLGLGFIPFSLAQRTAYRACKKSRTAKRFNTQRLEQATQSHFACLLHDRQM